jgi:hypothetical protein
VLCFVAAHALTHITSLYIPMLEPHVFADETLIVFDEEGQRILLDSSAAYACVSSEQLLDLVSLVSLPRGRRCYRFLQLSSSCWRRCVKGADVGPPQLAAAPENQTVTTISISTSAGMPHSTSAGALVTYHLDVMGDNGELQDLSMGSKPSLMAMRRQKREGGTVATTIASSGSNISSLRVSSARQKTWSCAPLSTLPLSALHPLQEWPVEGAAVAPSTTLPPLASSLSWTLPYQELPSLSLSASAMSPPSEERSTGRATTAIPATVTSAAAATAASHNTTSISSFPPPLEGHRLTATAPPPAVVETLPGNTVVLIALFTTVTVSAAAAAGSGNTMAVEVSVFDEDVCIHTPDARPTLMPNRLPSCQSFLSPTGKYLSGDVVLQSLSSAQYGVSSTGATATSGASFPSVTTPLTHTTSIPMIQRGASPGFWNSTTTGSEASGAVSTTATAGVGTNLGDSFTPSMVCGAAASCDGGNAISSERTLNSSFASAASTATAAAAAATAAGAAPLPCEASPQGPLSCLAASHGAFPSSGGVMTRVRCVYGDSRFSRRNAGRARANTAALPINASLSNTSFTNTSVASATPSLPHDGSGPLAWAGSGGGYVSSANSSFSSSFGAAGTMQPVPRSTQQPQQRRPQQHPYPRHPPPFASPASRVVASLTAAPLHAPFNSPNSSTKLFPSSTSTSTITNTTTHPLIHFTGAAGHPPWRNAVPPLPKCTISFTIALHIGRNKDVIRCLLRHYVENEIELTMKALKRGHPFLNSPATRDFVFGEAGLMFDADLSDEDRSEEDDDAVGGSGLRKSPSDSYARRSAANFAASASGDFAHRRKRTLTASQVARKTFLYRQYFAYLACCVEEHHMDLLGVVKDVARATQQVLLMINSSLRTPSNAVPSNCNVKAPLNVAPSCTTDEDGISSIPCAAKSTVEPSARSYENPELTAVTHPLTHTSGSETFYSTSGVYSSLARMQHPQSSIYEEGNKPDGLSPAHSSSSPSSEAVGLSGREVYGWLKLTPQTGEVTDVLNRPLSYLDCSRVGQLQRLRRNLKRIAPRTATELRISQLHLLLRGACDDEALAMEGLTYLVSVAKAEPCESAAGGTAGGSSKKSAGSSGNRNGDNDSGDASCAIRVAAVRPEVSSQRESVSSSPLFLSPERRSALAKAFVRIQQSNEEVGWFTEIENAVAGRRIKPAKLLELVERLKEDPNAIVYVWYSADEDLRETLKVASQYLTRRPRAG